MKFSIERNALRDALTSVATAVAGKSTLPILGNVLITAAPGRIGFNATDLDIAVSVSAPGETETPGEATPPAQRLLEIAKQLPEGIVRFTQDAKSARTLVEGGKARFKLLGLPSSEFPTFPKVDFPGGATIQASVLQQMAQNTAYAVATSSSRPILSGVLLELRPDTLRMVATDGHRLAKFETPTTGGSKGDVIIPPQALALVQKLFDADAQIEVARTANNIGFRSGDTFVLSRLIEGPYPNYGQVLPTENNRAVVFDRDTFVAALRRMTILADGQSHSIRLTGTPTGIKLSSQTADLGEASEAVVGTWEGEPIEIGANANFLLDCIRRVPTDEVRMTFKAPERPMTVEPVGWNDASSWFGVVMPLRLVA